LKEFARLFALLDQTNKTNEKVEILKEYFASASKKDILWVLSLFTGKKPKRIINSTLLRTWIVELSGIPEWLFFESYLVAGDFAETTALLLPPPKKEQNKSLDEWFQFLISLSQFSDSQKKVMILDAFDEMNAPEKLVFIKIITGSFRIGVSQTLVIRALSEVLEIEPAVVAHRLMGNWSPLDITFEELLHEENVKDDLSRPYPFCLAYAIENTPEDLGEPDKWQAEWKWDGIRAQIIWRKKQLFIWSRGEDLVTEKFPELHIIKNILQDDIVLDGEILAFRNDCPMPFSVLQTRIGRKNLSKNILSSAPIAFMIYDVLEYKNEDWREKSMTDRRAMAEMIYAELKSTKVFNISPVIAFNQWEDLKTQWLNSRQYYAEGIMLKRLDSPYVTGRKKGFWWKWKIDPLSIDGVLVYAQKGHGRRADLYTDYTFAVWDGDKLVPFAKAYSGLTDEEIRKVDNFVKRNIVEKFGPVRTVKPQMVFEIGFEGIQESKRHKSGVALRFPRILRWRMDKKVEDADTIETLKDILKNYHETPNNEQVPINTD
jgi:DNA ligase 1